MAPDPVCCHDRSQPVPAVARRLRYGTRSLSDALSWLHSGPECSSTCPWAAKSTWQTGGKPARPAQGYPLPPATYLLCVATAGLPILYAFTCLKLVTPASRTVSATRPDGQRDLPND